MAAAGQMIFYDIGLASESEVSKLFGFNAKQLSLAAINVTVEEGKEMNLFPISLAGMPAGDVAAMRKLRCYQRASIQMKDLLLRPERQIARQQGQEVFSSAVKSHMEKRPTEVRAGQRWRLNSYGALKETSGDKLKLEQEELQAELAAKREAEEGSADSGDSSAEGQGSGSDDGASEPEEDAFGLDGDEEADEDKKKKKKRKKARAEIPREVVADPTLQKQPEPKKKGKAKAKPG